MLTWSMLRAAHPLKKQGYSLKVSELLYAKPDILSNFSGDWAGGCYPAQLRSRGFFLQEENYHSLPIFGDKLLGMRRLSSQVSETSSEENDAKDPFVDLGKLENDPKGPFVEIGKLHSFSVVEDINAKKEGEELVSEPGFLDDDLSDSEEVLSSREPLKKEASLELLRTIMENPGHITSTILNNFVKGGDDLSQVEASKIIYSLGKRRMYGKALQVSEWLETTKHFEFSEYYYASHIDLIAKVRGVDVAEKNVNNVPDSFRGELLYRTLLANCVFAVNRKKAEAVFEKMRKLGLPITVHTCNQMIILYRRFSGRNVADILSIMEEENLKPSRLTYRNLIAIKGESKDTMGMEQLVEAMKSLGLQPDIHVLTISASHYISQGLKDKALTILNEIEGGYLQNTGGARGALLSLYASLDMADDVSRIWTFCKLDPTMNECLAAIAAWGKLGKVEEAEAVFNMMLEKWKILSSKIYAQLLAVYVQNNQISKGKEFVKRVGDSKGWIGPLVWDGLVKLYVGAGDVEKANSVLSKAVEMKTVGRVRPMFNTFLFVMEQFAKLGDIHNTEKWLFRMKQCGYTGRLKPFEILIQAYKNAKSPAYGLRERMKAESIYPNKSVALHLAEIETLQREVLLFKSKRKEVPDVLD